MKLDSMALFLKEKPNEGIGNGQPVFQGNDPWYPDSALTAEKIHFYDRGFEEFFEQDLCKNWEVPESRTVTQFWKNKN